MLFRSNLPNLGWQTYRQPSGQCSEPWGPHLPGSLTSVTHGGSQGPPLCPRPDPRSESPSPGGLPGLLPDGGAVGGHGSHAAQVRYPREPRPAKAPPRQGPAPPKPRPHQSPAPPPPESWEVPARGSPVFQGCVGRAPLAWGGAAGGRGQSQPAQPLWTLCLSTDACSPGDRDTR